MPRGQKTRDEIEQLLAGESIEKPIHEDITYEDIYRSQDNLWNFLYFTGYLKSVGESFRNGQVYVAACDSKSGDSDHLSEFSNGLVSDID